jgi:hypothetical protein
VKVVPYFGKDVRVYIQASEQSGGRGRVIMASRRVTGNGVTGFVLPVDKVFVVRAYADVDGDGRQSPSDPAASISGLKPEADINAPHVPVLLTLPGTGAAPDWPQKGAASQAPQDAQSPESSLIQRGIEKVQEFAPELPVPPLPVPPPPR